MKKEGDLLETSSYTITMTDTVTQFTIAYRPKTLDEVRGQDQIVKDLRRRQREDVWPKAMLFQGPFGTGKTTLAQIVAAMMEACDKQGNPDWDHPSNKSILRETFDRDVERVDGSQFSKADLVDFTAHLKMRPMYDKRRIIIIEEADQLSTAAINALLKVMESPQPNVHFILLSMEEKGIPGAIKSRCQVFKVKPLSITDIMLTLHDVMIKSGYEDDKNIPASFKVEGLGEIAKTSGGSMRTALSNLERCLSAGIFTKEAIQKEFFVVDETSTMNVLRGILRLSTDESVWSTLSKANPQEVYNYMTSILASALMYDVSGYLENDYFENSYRELLSYRSGDTALAYELYDMLENSPCLNKAYMRKADLIGMISQFYKKAAAATCTINIKSGKATLQENSKRVRVPVK